MMMIITSKFGVILCTLKFAINRRNLMQSWKAVVVKFVTFEQTNYYADDDDDVKFVTFEQTNCCADDDVVKFVTFEQKFIVLMRMMLNLLLLNKLILFC